jgi:Kef-type K+ transport system membrane component KefB
MRRTLLILASVATLCLLLARPAFAAGADGDPVAPVLLSLVVISAVAVLGGRLMGRLGQPAVLGELLAGVLVGNFLFWIGEPTFTLLREGATLQNIINHSLTEGTSLADSASQLLPPTEHTGKLVALLSRPEAPEWISIFQFIDLLSRIAVIVLLFLVGLHLSVREMRKVGVPSLLVAVVGIVLPFLLGYFVTGWVVPDAADAKRIFIGAILTATSVGITARVFKDLNQAHRTEAVIILGAAVIDDVLGLIILAVVSGLVTTGTISLLASMQITFKAVFFLAAAIGIGVWISPRIVRRLARLEFPQVKLLFGLGFAFVLSWAASEFGLAAIVGAFAAGLVLEELFLNEIKGESLGEMLSPIESLIVPVFFVLMGVQVKLEAFLNWQAVGIALALSVAAIVGKVAAGYVCKKPLDRLSIGIGMMPRGEVGLIFAGIGKGLNVVSDGVFSAVIIMVMITTLLTPPLLKITLARSEARA